MSQIRQSSRQKIQFRKKQATLISAVSQDKEDFANRHETRIHPNLEGVFDDSTPRKTTLVEDLATRQTKIENVPTLTDLPDKERLI